MIMRIKELRVAAGMTQGELAAGMGVKKHKDDTERIDPVAACMNALARALVRRNNPTLADRIDQGVWGM